jgi:uncharacterized protein (TIGR02466 family)
MELYSIFPVAIGKDVINLNATYKSLLINNIQEQEEKNKSNTDRVWTGDENNNEYLHNENLFNSLYVQINEKIQSYITSLGYNPQDFSIYFQRSWATVSRISQKILLHSHQQSHLSFAYYLSLPEGSGNLEFNNDRSYMEIINGSFDKPELLLKLTKNLNSFNAPNVTIGIKEDEIYIFPSKLKHKTNPGSNTMPRISLSSDIVITLNENFKNTEAGMADISNWKKF